MVTSGHVHDDACTLAVLNSRGGFWARRVVQAGEAEELHVRLDGLAVLHVNRIVLKIPFGDAENTKTLRSELVRLEKDLSLQVLGLVQLGEHHLNGALGMNSAVTVGTIIHHAHELDA